MGQAQWLNGITPDLIGCGIGRRTMLEASVRREIPREQVVAGRMDGDGGSLMKTREARWRLSGV